jgi:ribosomal protein S18 acetylase RimI-like enzyme
MIRKATTADFESILELIQELALFENEPKAVVVTVDELVRDFKNKCFDCIVAVQHDVLVGMALFYNRYSTWKGKTIHLEDLVVRKSARKQGIGKALLEELISIAKHEQVRRLEWCVLDWNSDAIALYEKTGAAILKDWYIVQMDEQTINAY